jgi:hypothetical protein
VVEWSCAVSTLVYLGNRAYSRAVGPSGGVPPTLLTSAEVCAAKFRAFGCIVLEKLPDKLFRKLGENAFRGVIVSYPSNAEGYCVYNPVTRLITTYVHVMFQESILRFGVSTTIDFWIRWLRSKPSLGPCSKSRTWVRCCKPIRHAHHGGHECPYHFDGLIEICQGYHGQAQHDGLQIVVASDGSRLHVRPCPFSLEWLRMSIPASWATCHTRPYARAQMCLPF